MDEQERITRTGGAELKLAALVRIAKVAKLEILAADLDWILGEVISTIKAADAKRELDDLTVKVRAMLDVYETAEQEVKDLCAGGEFPISTREIADCTRVMRRAVEIIVNIEGAQQ